MVTRLEKVAGSTSIQLDRERLQYTRIFMYTECNVRGGSR